MPPNFQGGLYANCSLCKSSTGQHANIPWVHNQSLSDHTRAKNRKMLILKSIRKQRPDVFESNIKNIIILSSKTLCGCEKNQSTETKKYIKITWMFKLSIIQTQWIVNLKKDKEWVKILRMARQRVSLVAFPCYLSHTAIIKKHFCPCLMLKHL